MWYKHGADLRSLEPRTTDSAAPCAVTEPQTGPMRGCAVDRRSAPLARGRRASRTPAGNRYINNCYISPADLHFKNMCRPNRQFGRSSNSVVLLIKNPGWNVHACGRRCPDTAMYTELACQGVFYSKLHSTRCTCTCTRYSGSTRIFRVFICTLKYGCRHFSRIYLYIRLYPEVLVPSGTSLYSLRVQRSTSTCTCTFYLYMYFEVQLYMYYQVLNFAD